MPVWGGSDDMHSKWSSVHYNAQMLPPFAPGPYVGRLVHFDTRGPKNNGPHAAIITAVHGGDVCNLTVFGGSVTFAPQTLVFFKSPEDARQSGGCTWLPHEERERMEQERGQRSTGCKACRLGSISALQ